MAPRTLNLLMEGRWMALGCHPPEHYVEVMVTTRGVYIWMSYNAHLGWSVLPDPWNLWEWQGDHTLVWWNRETRDKGNTWHRVQ